MITSTDLDTEIQLSPEQIRRFRRDGYIKLKTVLSPATIERFEASITEMVGRMNKQTKSLQDRDTYGKAFLQIINIWRKSEEVKQFVMGKRLARIATQLMGASGVRLYHDQALYKEPGGGYTPWHVDQFYWPLANENTVTAWIPLVEVPMERGPLEFSVGSQKIKFGRDFAISDESEKRIDEHLKMSDFPVDSSPFDLGEVSFHYGFTFHRAGPNHSQQMRKVMTIIYMDKDMRLSKPSNQKQQNDWDAFMPGAQIGEVIDTPLNPVVYAQS